jgi:hypothetical protein
MSFLIICRSGKKYLFDAGARKDYWNYSPMIVDRFRKGVNVGGMRIEKGVEQILETVVLMLREGSFIVGPGFKDSMLPG